MSKPEQLPPLGPELQQLIERGRLPDPPAEVNERMFSGIAATVGLPDGGPGPGEASQAAPPAEGAAGGASGLPAAASPAAAGLSLALGNMSVPLAAAIFAVGAVAGAGTHALLTRPASPSPSPAPIVLTAPEPDQPEVALPAKPAPRTSGAATSTKPGQASESSAPHPARSARKVPRPLRPEVKKRPGRRSSSAERHLLEMADEALRQGHTDRAIAAVQQHRKRFAGGPLSEQRDYIYIRALARANRSIPARAAAGDFRRRYPRSLYLPRVEALLKTTTP